MVIIAANDVSGPTKGIFQFIVDFKKYDAELHLYNFKTNTLLPEEFMRAAQSIGIQVHLFEQGNRSYLSLVRQAISQAKEKRINIVQTHGFKPSMIGFLLRLILGTKWICFMHGTTNENIKVRFYNFLDSLFQTFADKVVLVSESQRRKIFMGNRSNVYVIHNAIDLHNPVAVSAKSVALRESLHLQEGVKLIMVVGRLSPEKGVDIFLEAFSQVLYSQKGIHAVIVGDGQEKERLMRQSEKLGIHEHVHFAGYTKNPGDFMQHADIVVIPSRSEGIPNVALEAMALKKPVIATSVGGVPEVIVHGESGILVPACDPHAMAESILSVISSRELSDKLLQGAAERVHQEFSKDHRSEKIYSIYEELIS